MTLSAWKPETMRKGHRDDLFPALPMSQSEDYSFDGVTHKRCPAGTFWPYPSLKDRILPFSDLPVGESSSVASGLDVEVKVRILTFSNLLNKLANRVVFQPVDGLVPFFTSRRFPQVGQAHETLFVGGDGLAHDG